METTQVSDAAILLRIVRVLQDKGTIRRGAREEFLVTLSDHLDFTDFPRIRRVLESAERGGVLVVEQGNLGIYSCSQGPKFGELASRLGLTPKDSIATTKPARAVEDSSPTQPKQPRGIEHGQIAHTIPRDERDTNTWIEPPFVEPQVPPPRFTSDEAIEHARLNKYMVTTELASELQVEDTFITYLIQRDLPHLEHRGWRFFEPEEAVKFVQEHHRILLEQKQRSYARHHGLTLPDLPTVLPAPSNSHHVTEDAEETEEQTAKEFSELDRYLGGEDELSLEGENSFGNLEPSPEQLAALGEDDQAEIPPTEMEEAMPKQQDSLSVLEVADALNVSSATVSNLMKAGSLKGKKVGRAWTFSREAVEKLAAKRAGKPRRGRPPKVTKQPKAVKTLKIPETTATAPKKKVAAAVAPKVTRRASVGSESPARDALGPLLDELDQRLGKLPPTVTGLFRKADDATRRQILRELLD